MANFLQAFGTRTQITMSPTFSTLTSGSTSTGAVDNSSTLYDEIIVDVKVGYNAADVTTAWCDVRILASTDGGTTYSNWETPYLVLPALDASGAGTSTSPTYALYHARFVPPKHWTLAVRNNTTQTLNQGEAYYTGVYYTGA